MTNTTKTSFQYGAEYALSLPFDERTTVDVARAVHSSVDIPTEDYLDMKRNGISEPDAREYWDGFNSESHDSGVADDE